MNNGSKTARFVVAMSGALIVVAATWKVRHPDDATRIEANRSIASLRTETGIRADNAKQRRIETGETFRPENKARGSFFISIAADDGLGGTADATIQPPSRIHLKGSITAEKHIAAHDFTWILPQNYKLIDGLTNGTIPELRQGQTHEVRITVDRGAEPAQPIVLHVFKMINSEPRGQVAQFETDPAVKKSRDANAEKSAAHLRDERFVQ